MNVIHMLDLQVVTLALRAYMSWGSFFQICPNEQERGEEGRRSSSF